MKTPPPVQLSLDDAPRPAPPRRSPPAGPGAPRNPLEARYRAWRDGHPQVFALFRRFAQQMLANDRRFGVGALAERVRWEVLATWTKDEDGYRLNNNHRAYIARDLIEEMPPLKVLLETRKVTGEFYTETEDTEDPL